MVEITSTEMTPPVNDSHEFIPMRGIRNRHLQTMLPRLIRRKVKFNAHWQRLVVFHGLEGSLNSPYAHGLIEAAQKRGWLGVVMHFRGCSGEPNRLNRIYHPVKRRMEPGFYAGYSGSSAPFRQPPWAIRSAVICWRACWRKKAAIFPSRRR